MLNDKDNRYMRMAIKLARQGARAKSIDLLTGAVAVIEGRAVGHGFANAASTEPAVLQAMKETGSQSNKATLYVSNVPCLDASRPDHCLNQLIDLRPFRVVIGFPAESEFGPNDRRTIECLRSAGILVDTGACAAECGELNEVYYKFKRTGLPFVTVKIASTLDGRIATATGDSQWISGERSLKLAHELRRDHDAVLVGIGTVLKDDPQLTVRRVKGRDPLRIVVDSRLRLPLNSRLLANGHADRTIVATAAHSDKFRVDELRKLGAEVLELPVPDLAPGSLTGGGAETRVDLGALLGELGRRGIGSILVEGGAGIITSLISAELVDRLVIAIAPKIIGKGVEAIGDLKIDRLKNALTFSSLKTKKLGQDLIFDGRLARRKET